jgi:hypothetical protein
MTCGLDVSTETSRAAADSARTIGRTRASSSAALTSADAGARRFAADVDQVRAVVEQAPRMRERPRRIEMPSAVGERVGRRRSRCP